MSKENYDLFKHEWLKNEIIRIYDASDTIIYLIIGKEKAALIDTGYGLGDLNKYVKQFIDLPIIALMTHAHRDHAMGSVQFESYLNPLDYKKYEMDSTIERRKSGMIAAQKKKCNGLFEYAEESDWLPPLPVSEFHPLYDGDIIDLGGITIEAYSVKGHADGGMVFLIPEEKTLIVGDACGWDTRIFCSVEEYLQCLIKVNEITKGRYERVMNSHSGADLPSNIIEGQILVCKEVMDGKDDKIPFEHPDLDVFYGRDMKYAKELIQINGNYCRKDGGVGGLVYDANIINQKKILNERYRK